MSRIFKNPYFNGLFAEVYIIIVALIMHTFSAPNTPDTPFDGVAAISLFVLSAAVMGFLFIGEPLQLYLNNEKKNALTFFGKTLLCFACITLLILLGLKLHRITSTATFDGRNASFMLDGKQVALEKGVAEIPVENSSAKDTIHYFGNEATGDLNGDGLPDKAFIVSDSTGGSGTFYYVVAALRKDGEYTTTNAFYIGDRIAPQSTEIHADARELHVNYADREPGQPMVMQPSVGKVLLLKVTPAGVLEGLMK
jgi:hypothetical protein